MSYYGHYDFILNELFPKKKKEFKKYLEFLNHSQEFHYLWMFEGIAFVSDFPKKIERNDRNQLHDYEGPALLYRDTYSLYQWNGVTITKEISDKTTWEKEDILNEKNADIRREIIRKIGIGKAIEIMGAEVVDTYKSKVGGEYQLIMIDYDGRGKRPYLKMKNPSMKNVWHIEGVKPEIKSVKDALCFRNNLETFEEPGALT